MRYLQRYLGWATIPNLTTWLIALQVCGYLCLYLPNRGLNQAEIIERMQLLPDRILAGEWWRVVTFLCFPPVTNPIFAFFAWWFFYLMGTYLEAYWGAFKFNVFVWIWWAGTVAVSVITGKPPAANYFLQQSVFLAFAYLLPDFVIQLFFILPVKVKWLAWFTWAMLLFNLIVTDWPMRFAILAGVGNFIVYFWRDVLSGADTSRRRVLFAARMNRPKPAWRHRCVVCGATDRSHPDADFRYCSQCAGQACYCDVHLKDHVHLVAEPAETDQ
ncbi:MAG: hypothetical protein ACK5Q5_22405 [Planctomycetaceae bacterium]